MTPTAPSPRRFTSLLRFCTLASARYPSQGANAAAAAPFRPQEAGLIALIDKLERRLALPGDDETLRKRKVAAFFAGIAGAVTAILFAALYFYGGAEVLGWLYLYTVVWTVATLGILLVWPRTYYACVLSTSIYVTIHPWLVVLASGGYQSGLLPMIWALVGVAGSLLFLGVRPALLNATLYVIMACVAIVLDPAAAARAPLLPDWIRLTAGLISALVPGMMVVLISLYLFQQLERAKGQADRLLLNVLPAAIADQLKRNDSVIADGYDDVTVLFADIVDFTRLSAAADPCDVVGLLDAIFSEFDALADRYRLEKIKTIGDAYMVVGGLPEPRSDHAEAVVAFALDILAVVQRYRAWNGEGICLRVGIHSGPTVAGVIGRRKFIYDLWGDTVNTASRMESYGVENVIQVTETVRGRLDGKYAFEPRGPVYIKGKGEMMTYLLRPRPAGSSPLPPT